MIELYWVVYKHKDGYFDWLSAADLQDLIHVASVKDLFTIKDIECTRPWEIIRGNNKGCIEAKRFENMTFIRLTFF